jgi:hypothetical protein
MNSVPVRYELSSCILYGRNVILKGLRRSMLFSVERCLYLQYFQLQGQLSMLIRKERPCERFYFHWSVSFLSYSEAEFILWSIESSQFCIKVYVGNWFSERGFLWKISFCLSECRFLLFTLAFRSALFLFCWLRRNRVCVLMPNETESITKIN